MTKLKSIYQLLLLSFLILFPTQLNASELDTALLFYNDMPIQIPYTPILKENRMYARLRDLTAILSLDISYNATTHEAMVSNGTSIFTYHLDSGYSLFNDLPVFLDSPTFIDEDFTWVPVASFCQLFGFTVTPNTELLITHYKGEGQLQLNTSNELISYPIYDYSSVYSLFINDSVSSNFYTEGSFTAYIKSAFVENGILYLTFSPFTQVTYPDGYCLISDPRLLNISSQTLTLPTHTPMSYTYLTYQPDTFSDDTTTIASNLYTDVLEGDLILAHLDVSNGSILSIRQIYVP